MPEFKIEDRELVMHAAVYIVEAPTKEEALDKYVNELAGSLKAAYEYFSDEDKEGTSVIK